MKKSWMFGVVLVLLGVFTIGVFLYMNARESGVLLSNDIEPVATTTDTAPLATSTEEVDESEAKAEPSLRALDVKPWEWVSATYADGHTVAPNTEGDFVMIFGAGGGVLFETDCNSMSSSYEAYTGGLTFAPIASTKMYCEGSKESEFSSLIASTKTYHFTDKGELVLKTEAGDSIVFR